MLFVYIFFNLLLTIGAVEITFKYFDSEKQSLKASYLKYMILCTTLCLFMLVYFDFTVIYTVYFYISLILLIPLFITDAIYYHISSLYLTFLFILFTVIKFWLPIMSWQDSFLGMGLAFLLLETIILISRGGMGRGDRNLLALFGYMMGFKIALMTFVIAIFLATVMLLFHIRKEKRKQYMPFGPYLVTAFLMNILYGESLFHFYLQLY